MRPPADKLYGESGSFPEGPLAAPSHSAKTTTEWYADCVITVLLLLLLFVTGQLVWPEPHQAPGILKKGSQETPDPKIQTATWASITPQQSQHLIESVLRH